MQAVSPGSLPDASLQAEGLERQVSAKAPVQSPVLQTKIKLNKVCTDGRDERAGTPERPFCKGGCHWAAAAGQQGARSLLPLGSRAPAPSAGGRALGSAQPGPEASRPPARPQRPATTAPLHWVIFGNRFSERYLVAKGKRKRKTCTFTLLRPGK